MGNKNVKHIEDKTYKLATEIYKEHKLCNKYMDVEQIKYYIDKFYKPVIPKNNKQIYNEISNNNINYQKGIIIYTDDLKKQLKSIKLECDKNMIKDNHKSINEIKYSYDDDYSSTLMSPKYNEIIYLVDDSPDISYSISKFITFILTINIKIKNIKYKI